MGYGVMVDLETLSLDYEAMLLSIGAVSFPLPHPPVFENEAISLFYRKIKLEGQQAIGREFNPETLRWWFTQPSHVQKEAFDANGLDLAIALSHFMAFLPRVMQKQPDEIWSNGADFDIPILQHYFRRNGYQIPWSYKSVRCFRTLKELHPGHEPEGFDKNKHNALEDALHQTKWLHKIMRAF